jgi:hypothetical protein
MVFVRAHSTRSALGTHRARSLHPTTHDKMDMLEVLLLIYVQAASLFGAGQRPEIEIFDFFSWHFAVFLSTHTK